MASQKYLAQYRARNLARWHARKATDPDFAAKELARRAYKGRRYHRFYKKDPVKMAKKRQYERERYEARKQACPVRSNTARIIVAYMFGK